MLQILSTSKRSTTLCLPSLWSLRWAVPCQPPDIIHIRNDPPLYVFFSLELATGCATPPSRYYPHPKRSFTLCLPSLWSLRRAAPRPPPDIIHIRNDPPLYVYLLFGACYGLRHAPLPILSTFETIHHSMSSFSLELATGHAMPASRYYPLSKRSTTLCLASLWSLRRASDIIHIRNDAPLYVFLLFGACDGHQILSTSEGIYHSMSSFSLELATCCATQTSSYYPHPKRSATLCLNSL